MGITMFIQMRMNPTPPDPTQAMIFTWMPVVFTFMLATFPAGLVIYWAWNNTLSILQQGVHHESYARAQKTLVKAWQSIIMGYLQGRPNLRRVFVLIDSRHGLKPIDLETLDQLDEAAVSYQIVLTKADKLKQAERDKVLAGTMQAISKRPAAFPDVIITSSEKGWGIPELRAEIAGLRG
jgi:membrane protein insertase Oxa1/YidC/SpoIIIJ